MVTERSDRTTHTSAEFCEPGVGAVDNLSPLVTSQRATVLFGEILSVGAVWRDQFDSSMRQELARRVAV
jgi:hypothetical protein